MVGFKNRYMVLEVILDPNRELVRKDPVIITSYNVTNAIKDSILENFGKCGLASSFGSFLGKSWFQIIIVSFIVYMDVCN